MAPLARPNLAFSAGRQDIEDALHEEIRIVNIRSCGGISLVDNCRSGHQWGTPGLRPMPAYHQQAHD